MNDAATVAAWAAAIAAFVGPIIGVISAHQMMQQSTKRQEASQLFRKVIEDALNFRHALMERLSVRLLIPQSEEIMELVKEIRSATVHGQTVDQRQQHEHAKATYEAKVESHLALSERHVRATHDHHNIESLLNADKLSLRLIFGKQCDKCKLAIDDLIMLADKYTGEDISEVETCSGELRKIINRISDELEPLYDSLRRGESLGDET